MFTKSNATPCFALARAVLSAWATGNFTNFEDGALMLYNLRDDIGEQKDLAQERPQLVKKLHDMLRSWRKETGAIVPTANSLRSAG